MNGTEDLDAIDTWHTDTEDNFEFLIPGAKELMKRGENSRSKITVQQLLAKTLRPLALSVSRKLYSLLKKKTTGQARNQMKA